MPDERTPQEIAQLYARFDELWARENAELSPAELKERNAVMKEVKDHEFWAVQNLYPGPQYPDRQPAWSVNSVGPLAGPGARGDRRALQEASRESVRYRGKYAVTDPDLALGPELDPARAPAQQIKDRDAAQKLIDKANHSKEAGPERPGVRLDELKMTDEAKQDRQAQLGRGDLWSPEAVAARQRDWEQQRARDNERGGFSL